MEIPDYQSVMLPLLKFVSDMKEHSFREAIDHISNFFNLTEEQRKKRFPSRNHLIINNRVGWAKTYLKKAKLLKDTRRGYFKISQRGLEVIKTNPSEINNKFLSKFHEFINFKSKTKKDFEKIKGGGEGIEEELETPEELIEKGYKALKESLAQDLLEKLRTNSPDFFERVVVDLLVKMGYGEGEVTGGPGDGGIDGIIYQDKLGLDKIYLQAKRYAETKLVNPTMIKNFVGTLDIKGATKGIFITTSSFVGDIREVVEGTHKNIILIDGEKISELMIDYGVGVTTENYPIKKIDSDYFEED